MAIRRWQDTDGLDELLEDLSFRVQTGGRSRITHREEYPAKSPFNRLFLGKAGHGKIESEGRVLDLAPGYLVLVPTETPAVYIKPKGLEFFWIYFRAAYVGGMDFFQLGQFPALAVAAPRAGTLFRRMLRLHHGATLADRLKALAALVQLLAPFLRRFDPVRFAATHSRMSRLLPVIRFIEDHLAEPLSLETLSERAFLNPVYFSNHFCSVMGLPPMRYVNRRRIQRARELLLVSDFPIKEIAARTGFADPFHFSRVFRQMEGLSPRRYRQRNAISRPEAQR